MKKSTIVLGVTTCTLAFTGVVVAAEAVVEAVGAPPALFSSAFWKVVGTGLLSGLIASGIGLLKSKKLKDFDFKKALPALVIGAIVGAVAGYKGVELATAEAWLTTLPFWAGLTSIIEMGLKALWRKGMAKEDVDLDPTE